MLRIDTKVIKDRYTTLIPTITVTVLVLVLVRARVCACVRTRVHVCVRGCARGTSRLHSIEVSQQITIPIFENASLVVTLGSYRNSTLDYSRALIRIASRIALLGVSSRYHLESNIASAALLYCLFSR